jgi:hypothetical protein
MPSLHICNTFFESELESEEELPLAFWMNSHPVVSMLQTLPRLYGTTLDLVWPEGCDGASSIESWGASKAIDAWAKEKKISYSMPDWEIVKEVHSKVFSFLASPRLPGAELLQNEREVLLWIEKTPGQKVLKTAFGTAGRGHFHIPGKGNLAAFLKREFAKGLPLIGEPWMERTLDFSTQWKNGEFLGATVFENTPNGSYRATIAGPRSEIFGPYEWALEEHLAVAQPIVQQIYARGFFGHLGVDAYVYDKELLQPVVEINARKTMSWVALALQQKKDPGKTLRLSFSPKNGVSL